MNNDKNRNVKDNSQEELEKKYGNYVENDLLPQLSKLNALKLTANPLEWRISTKEDDTNNKIKEILDDALSSVDINRIAYVLEERLASYGNGVIVFENMPTGGVNLYVPTTAITKVDPSSGALLYLQIIRYVETGDLVNVVSELHTLQDTTYSYQTYNSIKEAKKDIKEVKDSNGRKKLKGTAKNPNAEDMEEFKKLTKGIEFNRPLVNPLGWIKAVYFENIPTVDGRGKPDLYLNSRYAELLNQVFIRFHWELIFNKPKFITDEEMGVNWFSSRYNNIQNQGMVENNYAVRRNGFMYSLGQANSGMQYFETSNQNLLNLIQLFNYFLKKLWEQSGQHQSGSDIGKQLSDFQAVQEKSAEHLTYKNKVIRRKYLWRELLWRILLSLDCEDANKMGKAPKGLKKTNIEFMMSFAKIDIEKDIIDNEIKKLQANLTDRESAMIKIADLSPGQDMEALAEKILKSNNKDIEEQLKSKPIQIQQPSIHNPQGKDNNQTKSFYKQESKGGK